MAAQLVVQALASNEADHSLEACCLVVAEGGHHIARRGVSCDLVVKAHDLAQAEGSAAQGGVRVDLDGQRQAQIAIGRIRLGAARSDAIISAHS
jgi:hypothetical protein